MLPQDPERLKLFIDGEEGGGGGRCYQRLVLLKGSKACRVQAQGFRMNRAISIEKWLPQDKRTSHMSLIILLMELYTMLSLS